LTSSFIAIPSARTPRTSEYPIYWNSRFDSDNACSRPEDDSLLYTPPLDIKVRAFFPALDMTIWPSFPSPNVTPFCITESNHAFTIAGIEKLYIGNATTTISADFN
jgi:hypothetical protein